MIACKGLGKRYGTLDIFSDVTLNLKKSEISVLRGPSGCGKTTLFKCLAMLESWDSGCITISDHSITGFESTKELKRTRLLNKLGISVVFQQLFLWPHMTCRENINFVSNEDFDWSVAEMLEVSSIMEKKPSEISLGQAQRVAYLRAVSCKPKYLFLDEVTSALDHENVSIVANLVNELKLENTSIFVITHSDEFEKLLLVDQKFEMNNGMLTNV